MYEFYSTNFNYQPPAYPNPYAYNGPDMNSSCAHRFPGYGFHSPGPIHTTAAVPSYQPCERVSNVSILESVRMANNTPLRSDFCTKTLHHFPPTPPPNINTINCSDEPLKKQSMDKMLEDSDEGKTSFRVCSIDDEKVLSLALIWNDRLKTALRFNCFYNSTLWTIDWIFWTRKWVFNTASTPSQRTLGLQCCLKFRATWSRSCIIESVARCQGQSKHGTKLRCIRKLDIISLKRTELRNHH